MSQSSFQASIIIPHFDDVVRLSKCLEALLPQMVSTVELVVVDNGSTQSLEPVLTRFPSVRIVVEPQKGAANARNRGVAETVAPKLFFLDCDCIPAENWVQTALQKSDIADIVGGRIEVFDETPHPRTGAQAFERVFAFDNRFYVEKRGFSVTANLLTRRDVFQKTGPFLHGLSEDLDWCHRAVSSGFRLAYVDALGVSHPSRGDWTALRRKWRRLTDEGFGVNGAKTFDRIVWGFRALAMPLSVIAHMPKVLCHSGLHGAKERFRAIVTLVRLRLLRMLWMLEQAVWGK